jgi:exopolysaccharide biosynthesis WecB/TagA/CpsF family protein
MIIISSSLGQILLNSGLIQEGQLEKVLDFQRKHSQEFRHKLLGETLVDLGLIEPEELKLALKRQRMIYEVMYFELKPHPSITSRLKRVLDIAGALLGLGGTALLFPIILLITLNNFQGSIFVSQYRVGLLGRQFKIFKFRTEIEDNNHSRPVNVDRNRKQLFINRSKQISISISKFFRKVHIDELPLFLNVLKGEMSLVGIRPPTSEEVKHYDRQDWKRLAVKPGMTGLWLTNTKGRSRSFEKSSKLDLDYVERWQPVLDLKILFKTLLYIADNRLAKSSTSSPQKVQILSLSINNLRQRELLAQLKQGVVFTPNVDHLVKLEKDYGFFEAYSIADYIVCDSQILLYASYFLGTPIKEKISGSDFFPAFYNYHKYNENIKIFLLGGLGNSASLAQKAINKRVGRNIIIAAHSPSMGFSKNERECLEIIELINKHKPTVVAVGLGAPLQEKWIYKYKNLLPSVKIFIAIGATVDFEAGKVPRASSWMSQLGVEWFYRLLCEPNRLWRRYLIDDIKFFFFLLKQKMGVYRYPFFANNLRTQTRQIK